MMKFISILFLALLLFSNTTFAQIGTASWYGPGFQGKRTASGEQFNTHALTAAHKHLRFGTKVKVTNLKNKRSVKVRITDRGPFVKGKILDLSHAAKQQLGMGGTALVKLEVLN